MRSPNLVARVMIGLMVFGGTLAFMSAQIVDYANEVIETALLDELLEAQYRSVMHDGAATGLETRRGAPLVSVFSASPALAGAAAVPTALAGLAPGFHEDIVIDGRLHYVLVREAEGAPVYVAYDITHVEAVEDRSDEELWLVTAAIILLSSVVGYALAKAILAPIKRLARRVRELDPGSAGRRLDDERRKDEIGVIVGAINGLLGRIDRFVAREQEFAATASHELRTPIAVITGSADVLSVVSGLPEAARRPIARIVRATEDMNEIVTTLLFLAKERSVDPAMEEEHTDVDEVLRHAIDAHRHLLGQKELAIEEGTLEPTVVAAPRGVVSVVVNNLVRNAMQHTQRGVIAIALDDGVFTIRNPDWKPTPQSVARSSRDKREDLAPGPRKGLGLYLIERVCTRFGWRLAMQSAETGSVTVTVDFGNGTATSGAG